MDVDVVQRGEVAEFDDDVIEPDHSGIPSSLLPGLVGGWRVFSENMKYGEPRGLAIQLSKKIARGRRNYSAAFCVRVAQSALSQSGSAGALLGSAQ